MAWYINPYNLPTVRSYQNAKEVYEKSPEISSMAGWRGLHNKRDTSKIVRINHDGAIRFRYHHTDMVVYHSPTLLQVTRFDSSSSVMFANRFLPIGLDAMSAGGEMWVTDRHGNAYQPNRRDVLMFDLVDGRWQVQPDTVAEVEHKVLDRKLAARVCKTLRPLHDWRESVRRVGVRLERGRDLASAFRMIQSMLIKGHIPEEAYPALGAYELPNEAMYVLAGAVKRVKMPLGTMAKKSPYDHTQAWSYV